MNEPFVVALARHVRVVGRTLGGRTSVIVPVLAAIGCAFVPLADHLGFELAAVLTIVSALTSPAGGVAALRRDDEGPVEMRSPGVAVLAATIYGVLGIALAAGVILLNGFRRPTCEPLSGAVWLLVLPVPTCFLTTAIGALAISMSQSLFGAIGLMALAELGSLLWSLSSLYFGPAFFLFNHVFGYFPGPLYDDVVTITPPLLIFRGMTVLWAIGITTFVSARGAQDVFSVQTRRNVGAWLMIAVAAVGFNWGTDLGFSSTDDSVAATLGGVTQIDDLEIHYPREWSEKSVELMRRDAAYRAHQVITSLGIKEPKEHVRVWIYRSAEEKRRLVGASGTSFSKPWRHEVHINAAAFPHPVIRHELVHAFGAEIAKGPFAVPGGFFPNTPLIEGFAVALGSDEEGMSIMQWAKAMRDLHLAPDLGIVLSSTGFLTSAPQRAYTYAGAFIQFLADRNGLDSVLGLYASGSLQQIGDPADLIQDFERELDTISLTDAERATAARRYSRPSIFRRQCAREVSRITDEAHDLLNQGKPKDAVADFDRACSMEPDDPGLLRDALSAELRAGSDKVAMETADRLFKHPKLDDSLHASVLVDLGDHAWRTGKIEDARRRYADAASLQVDPQVHRNAYARLAALQDHERAALLSPLFLDGNADVAEILRMNDWLGFHPEDALVSYLLGRQLVQRDSVPRGILLLRNALDAGLGDDEMRAEASRLVIRSESEIHHCDAAMAITATEPAGAERQMNEDWVERCRFEVARKWKPLDDDK